MSGYKNPGQVQGSSTRGELLPSQSHINFAVPDVKTIRAEAKKTSFQKPGITTTNSKSGGKSFNICIDGKKLNSGFGKALGDVDMYGDEPAPTLADRTKTHASDKQHVE